MLQTQSQIPVIGIFDLTLSDIVTKLDESNTAHVFDDIYSPESIKDALISLPNSSSPENKAKMFGQFYGLSCSNAAGLKTFLSDI